MKKSKSAGDAPAKRLLRLKVNGETKEVATEVSKTLLEVLREDLGLTGTKHGCELGECGTCAVLVDGAPGLSCLLLGIEAENSEIVTVKG
jgi:carbon-monoxide dehydrogenase small subunit